MTSSVEAPALIQYACERCKTRFVLPPSSRKLSLGGKLKAFSAGFGAAIKRHDSFGAAYDATRRQILAKMDDEAYQSFVQSFRFCHECRQFVCNECWSSSRRSCLTCVAKAMAGTTKPRPPFAPAGPDIPRPVADAGPRAPRFGRLRRNLVFAALAIGVILLATEAIVVAASVLTPGPTAPIVYQPATASPSPGQSATATATATGSQSASPSSSGSASASPSGSPTATPTLKPGETPTPWHPTPTPPPTATPSPTPTPTPVTVYAQDVSVVYGNSLGAISVDHYSPSVVPLTAPNCTSTYTVGDHVGTPNTTSCSGGIAPSGYTFNSYVTGTVTITPRGLSVTCNDQPVTAPDPYSTTDYGVGGAGFVSGDGFSSNPSCSAPDYDANPVAGTYTIYISAGTLTNPGDYSVSWNNGQLTAS